MEFWVPRIKSLCRSATQKGDAHVKITMTTQRVHQYFKKTHIKQLLRSLFWSFYEVKKEEDKQRLKARETTAAQ